jgi:hypothetical protein
MVNNNVKPEYRKQQEVDKMDKSHYFDHVCQDTIPTKPDEEDVTPTDMISEAVEEIMDNIKGAFSPKEDDEEVR